MNKILERNALRNELQELREEREKNRFHQWLF